MVAQAAGLGRTARGVVLGVEVEYHLLAAIVAEQDLFTILVYSQTLGSLVSNIHIL